MTKSFPRYTTATGASLQVEEGRPEELDEGRAVKTTKAVSCPEALFYSLRPLLGAVLGFGTLGYVHFRVESAAANHRAYAGRAQGCRMLWTEA